MIRVLGKAGAIVTEGILVALVRGKATGDLALGQTREFVDVEAVPTHPLTIIAVAMDEGEAVSVGGERGSRDLAVCGNDSRSSPDRGSQMFTS